MLFAHGSPVTHFYLIVKGTFQLFRANANENPGYGRLDDLYCFSAGHDMFPFRLMRE